MWVVVAATHRCHDRVKVQRDPSGLLCGVRVRRAIANMVPGIDVFVTGGLGGVHRGYEDTLGAATCAPRAWTQASHIHAFVFRHFGRSDGVGSYSSGRRVCGSQVHPRHRQDVGGVGDQRSWPPPPRRRTCALCFVLITCSNVVPQGVTVAGFGTDDFPAFWSPASGFPVSCRVDTPEEAAALIQANLDVRLLGRCAWGCST